jgi:GMP synthase (glutamine-hydrolysing)
MKKPVLCIVHQEHSVPGRLGYALQQLGYPLDIRRPRFGDPLPETMDGHTGAVVFGGPMSANDSDDFVRREIDWMAVPIAEDKPLLGICLGAQMLARQLGAKVFCHAQGQVEVGYYPIRPTEAGLALSPLWPGHVYQWHREGFDLADGAELLAEGDCFPVQAFRYGSAVALQFHPEVTQAMMCRWTVRGAARLELPNARPRAQHFADRAAYDYPVRQWLAGFLDHWLAGPTKTARTKTSARAVEQPQAAASIL